MFLAYAAPAGRTLLDRELYLPALWTDDRDRCAEAGVPGSVGFATKPGLAARMLTRALDARVPAAWVTGDEAYGQVGKLARDARGPGDVLRARRPGQPVRPARRG